MIRSQNRWLNWLLVLATLLALAATATAVIVAIDALNGIQKERAASIRRSCVDQNTRHDETLRTLDRLLLERVIRRSVPASTPARVVTGHLNANLPKLPQPEREQLVASRAFTAVLIQALAPREDCDARVSRFVGTS